MRIKLVEKKYYKSFNEREINIQQVKKENIVTISVDGICTVNSL